jgi:predicted amidohydrolase YtcJ
MRCTSRSGSPISVTGRGAPSGIVVAVVIAACGGRKPTPPPGQAPAELVIRGGEVQTMDPARPRATAVAIRGGVIVAVGDDPEVASLIGPITQVIELRGETVTPGLVDGHCHLYGLGTDLDNISVRDTASAADAAAIVAARANTISGDWIVGRGWDQNRWPGQAFPTHHQLDAAAPGRPVMLRRVDGHALWANAEAMKRASITVATKDPVGGKIIRDRTGAPTGVFVDNAMDLIDAVIPAPSAATRDARIRRAAQVAVAAGITGVHEMGIDDATAAAYRSLVAGDADVRGRNRALPLRVYAYLAGVPAEASALRQRAPDPGDGRFALRGVKFFVDGALGSRGARLLADYADDPGNRGLWVTAPDVLTAAVGDAVAGGWQVAIHAIGDAGNRAVLDALAAALAQSGDQSGDHRLRIEHAQVIAPDDLPRFVAMGVIASMQPTHATSDMPWAEARVGPDRIQGAYAWRTLIASGATIVAGSDFPVEGVSPLLGIYAAVTRQDPAGDPPGGWYPDQRMTLDEAIAAFTTAPAYAQFAEASHGRVQPGMAGDLTIFDRRLVAGPGLLATKVRATIVAGEVVYEQDQEAAPAR